MLLALGNNAKYYQDGKVVEVPGKDLMSTAAPYSSGYTGFAFVAYPNRDSTPFREKYSIPEAQTVIRGTLRYAGNPDLIRCLVDLGFLSQEGNPTLNSSSQSEPLTWNEATASVLGASSASDNDLVSAISSKHNFPDTPYKNRIIAGLRWIGLLSTTEKIIPRSTPLDTLCATLEKKCAYEPEERDFVFLQHTFGIEHADGTQETRTSTLCEYGDPKGYTAMARTVGIPTGCAVLATLKGELGKGLLAPHTPEICDPLRKTLKDSYGIEMVEKTVDV